MTHPELSHTVTEMNVLLRPDGVDAVVDSIPGALPQATDVQVRMRSIDLECEPDNMLVAEYHQRFDAVPVTEQVHRLVVEADWEQPEGDSREFTTGVTAAIVGCLPPAPDGSTGLWFGNTRAITSSE